MMKRRISILACVLLVIVPSLLQAGITIDETTTFVTPTTTYTSSQTFDASSFNPNGSDKLVAVIIGRGASYLTAPTVTFNGQTMNHIVTRETPAAGTHRGVSSIFYLDSPPTGGNLVLTYNTQIQDLGIALFALSGTAAGFSGATLQSNSSLSGTITTSADGSLVIAGGWYGDHASSTLSVDSPLTSVLSAPIDTTNPFSAAAAGYYLDPDAGNVGISFTGSNGTPVNNFVAAEFTPLPPAGTILWSDLAASGITASGATLTAELAGNDGDVTAYWVAGAVADPAVQAWGGSDGPAAESLGTVSRTASSLTADMLYSFAFYGTNSTDDVEAWSEVATFTTALTASQKPVFMSTTSTPTSVTLEWTDNAANETGYILCRATNPAGPFAVVAALAANTTTYVDGALTFSTTYYYQLAATNSANGSATAFADCTTSETTATLDPYSITILDTGTYYANNTIQTHPYTVTDADLGNLNLAAASKLVVTVGIKGNLHASRGSRITATYGGEVMTLAAGVRNEANPNTWAGIFYLDNPTVVGDLLITEPDGGAYSLGVSALVLAGTRPLVSSSAVVQDSYSTAITTEDDDSLVVAAFSVGSGVAVTAESPMTQLLSISIGSGGHSVGYQMVETAGEVIPEFAGSTDRRVLAAMGIRPYPRALMPSIFRFR